MSSFLTPYSPRDLHISWGGYSIKEVVEDNFLAVVRNSDLTITTVGGDGCPSPVVSPNRSALVTVTLQQQSRSNAHLAGILNDQLYGSKNFYVADLTVADLSGSTILSLKDCWLQKGPDITRTGNTTEGQAWVWFCSEMIYTPSPDGASEALLDEYATGVSNAISLLKGVL